MSLPKLAEARLATPRPDPGFKPSELEVQVVLSLAQATLHALMNLSPLAYREIDLALRREAARLKDERATLTATLVSQYLPA